MSRILLFTSTFPKSADDPLTPRFVYHLGRELTTHHQVTVLAPHAPGAKLEENLDGLNVVRYRYFWPESSQRLAYGTGITNNLREHPATWLQAPSFFYCQWRALINTVRRFDIEVVNSHWMVPQGLTSALSIRSLGIKHVLTIHSAGLFFLRRAPLGKFFAKRILKNTDALYIVSQQNQYMLEDLINRPVSAHVLPMGIHTDYYQSERDPADLRRSLNLPENNPLILYVGKLSRIKGVNFLIEAMPQVLKANPDARLVVVGSGPEETSLKNQTETLGMTNEVIFTGQQGPEGVRDYLAACDTLVISSIQDTNGQVEGFPVVLLEALASGKPVVGTRLGGVPEGIEDGVNGFLVPPEDPEAIAEALLKILRQGPETFSGRAKTSVHQFDWKAVGQDYSDTFENLVNK